MVTTVVVRGDAAPRHHHPPLEGGQRPWGQRVSVLACMLTHRHQNTMVAMREDNVEVDVFVAAEGGCMGLGAHNTVGLR